MRKIMVTAIFGLSFIFNYSCGSSSSSNTPAPTPTAAPWTDTAMQNLILQKCSSCHNSGSRNYQSITESAMKSDTNALRQVNSGNMPQDGSLTSAEKTSFQNFYK